MLGRPPTRFDATLALLAACALWGLSFPVTKGLSALAALHGPAPSSWFVTAVILFARFGFATLALSPLLLKRPVRREVEQGLVLGVLAAAGMLLQLDALQYTLASTSAFLTQGYVVLIPIATALIVRAWPSLRVVLACLTVVAGLAVLADLDAARFHIGRGEAETLAASAVFAVQIMWLGRPRYARNRMSLVTLVMFATVAISLVPVVLVTAGPHSALAVFPTAEAWLMLALLTLLCTLAAFLLMNRYQPFVSPSEAGIIYGLEPLMASLLALFLPELISLRTGIGYPNETITAKLVLGGALILGANVVLQLPARRRAHAARAEPLRVID
jgi:drug/metabolite transporter (DMT)-like permease